LEALIAKQEKVRSKIDGPSQTFVDFSLVFGCISLSSLSQPSLSMNQRTSASRNRSLFKYL